MKHLFVGNVDSTRQFEFERLFRKYGSLDRVEMKAGYAFVYFKDERDAENAIRKLDNTPFGVKKRRLTVEWAKGEPRDGNPALKPTKTLFVVKFDPIKTRNHDIKSHFEPHGKVLNVQIIRNFAFVEFATQEDATKALKKTQGSKILDRLVTIEYALSENNQGSDHYAGSPRRSFNNGGSPSPPPHHGHYLSPKYNRDQGPTAYERQNSRDYDRFRSPEYDRDQGPTAYERQSSLDYDRYRSPEYNRDQGPAAYKRHKSPDYDRFRSPEYDRDQGPVAYERHKSPDYDRYRSPEYNRDQGQAAYERRRSPDCGGRHRTRSPRAGYDQYRNRSPDRRRRS